MYINYHRSAWLAVNTNGAWLTGFSQVIGRLELLFGVGGALLYPDCQSKLVHSTGGGGRQKRLSFGLVFVIFHDKTGHFVEDT